MEIIIFIALSLLLAVAPLLAKSERAVHLIAGGFFLTQVASIALIIGFGHIDEVMLYIFRADTLAVLFHILMTAVLGFTLIHPSHSHIVRVVDTGYCYGKQHKERIVCLI